MQLKLSQVCLPVAALMVSATANAQIALQNATATFSQTFDRGWLAREMIDGDTTVRNGWAIFRNIGANSTQPETAAFETVNDLTAAGLTISMAHNYSSNPGHLVGRFRWSYTTDSRNDFADGLQTGGDVTANWTVLTPTSVQTTAGLTSTVLGDGSVLMAYTGGVLPTAAYDLTFNTAVSGVTGLRLEVMADPSLPTGGPGMQSSNGNFVLTEVSVQAVPEPATLITLGVAAAGLIRRRFTK